MLRGIRKRKFKEKSSVSEEPVLPKGDGQYARMKIIFLRVALIISILVVFFLLYIAYNEDVGLIVDHSGDETVYNISCQPRRENEYPSCSPIQCARIIVSEFLSAQQVSALIKLVQKALYYGRANGGASIFDVYSGAISKGNQFINIYSLHAVIGEEQIFSSEDFIVFHQVKDMVLNRISNHFGIDSNKLYLTNPSFFSEMTPRPPQTIHDEYWHSHTDKETYEAFEYTSLVYLSEYGKDFKGGNFIYEYNDVEPGLSVRPRPGLLSVFTSGNENPHRVEKVTGGVRYALTLGFTCDSSKRINLIY